MSFPILKPVDQVPHFPGLKDCYQSEEGYFFSERYGGKNPTEALHQDFVIREDDVFLATFPKAGSTWLQELVWLIQSGLDYENAKEKTLFERSPFIELEIERAIANNQASPRVFKTHYPYSMLPKSAIDKKCKLIYSMRNPKDTVVSFYFFAKANANMDFDSDFATFFDQFLEGKVVYGPYWKHLNEYWNHRNEENILIVMYEDMQQDLVAVSKQICSFLGKSYTDQQLEGLASHCSFSEMKANPAVNPNARHASHRTLRKEISEFMRKGKVGDWKNYLSKEMNDRMDEFVEIHFGGSGLNFTYE